MKTKPVYIGGGIYAEKVERRPGLDPSAVEYNIVLTFDGTKMRIELEPDVLESLIKFAKEGAS